MAAAEAFEADEAASRGGVLMAAATRDDGTKSAGVIVQGAAQRRDELAAKMLTTHIEFYYRSTMVRVGFVEII